MGDAGEELDVHGIGMDPGTLDVCEEHAGCAGAIGSETRAGLAAGLRGAVAKPVVARRSRSVSMRCAVTARSSLGIGEPCRRGGHLAEALEEEPRRTGPTGDGCGFAERGERHAGVSARVRGARGKSCSPLAERRDRTHQVDREIHGERLLG